MTVPNTAIFNNYAGNDATTVFPYGFKIFAAADLEVIIADANDTQYLLVLDTDYTVSGVGEDAGGNVTYTGGGTPLPTNWIISIALNLEFVQETDLLNQGPYFAETQETALDRLTKMVQMLAEEITRCLKVSITSGVDPSADALVAALNAAVVAAETAQAAAEAAQAAAEAAQAAAEAAQAAAEAAQAAAEAAAALLPVPGVGDADKRLKVNAAEDAYELTDAQTATGAEIDATVAASHAQSHAAASHNDQTATGPELDALVAAGPAAAPSFGAWAARSKDIDYDEAAAGIVAGTWTGVGNIAVGGTLRQSNGAGTGCFTVPVNAAETWRVTGTVSVLNFRPFA